MRKLIAEVTYRNPNDSVGTVYYHNIINYEWKDNILYLFDDSGGVVMIPRKHILRIWLQTKDDK